MCRNTGTSKDFLLGALAIRLPVSRSDDAISSSGAANSTSFVVARICCVLRRGSPRALTRNERRSSVVTPRIRCQGPLALRSRGQTDYRGGLRFHPVGRRPVGPFLANCQHFNDDRTPLDQAVSKPYWNQSSRCAIGNIEVAVQKANASKSLTIAMALLAGATGFFLIAAKSPTKLDQTKARRPKAATAAGAKVTPTELRVEAK